LPRHRRFKIPFGLLHVTKWTTPTPPHIDK
jgi:hypothetical protein